MSIRAIIFKISSYVVRRIRLFCLCVLILGVVYMYATRELSVVHISVGKLFNFDNVQSLQVSNGMGDYRSPLFQIKNKKGESVIKKVVAWINSSKIVEGTTLPPITHGYSRPVILIFDNLREKGDNVAIFPAYNIETGENGKGISVAPKKSELVISQGVARYRIYSPELFNWFMGGWTRDK